VLRRMLLIERRMPFFEWHPIRTKHSLGACIDFDIRQGDVEMPREVTSLINSGLQVAYDKD
jgi:hypothetical protein